MRFLIFIGLFTIVLNGLTVNSQNRGGNEPVINYSFENWSGNPLNPDGYTTSNTVLFQPVTRSNQSTNGSFSLEGKVLNFMGGQIPPIATSDEFPVSKRYSYLKGYYTFIPAGTDTFQINVAMKKGSDLIGSGNIQFLNTQNSWQEFFIDIEYENQDIPTSCIITISLQDVIPFTNTSFKTDELEFGDPELFSTRSFIGSHSVPTVQFTDISTLTEAADDFIVPSGESWQLSGVKIYGTFSNGINGFQGAVANIRSDDNNKPGAIIYSDTITSYNYFFGQNIFIPFKNPVSLNPGRYWLNSYVRIPLNPDSSVYAWATSTANYGAPFHWRDPAHVFDTAANWTPGNQVVVGGGDPDLLFKLSGYADSVIGIQQLGTEIPADYTLEQNYPNPFNPNTFIAFNLPERQFVTLNVYNVLGEETSNLVNGYLNAGKYRYLWSGVNISSGIYFYRISAGNFTAVRKMVLVK